MNVEDDFLLGNPAQQISIVLDKRNTTALTKLLGGAAYTSYRKIALEYDRGKHLANKPTNVVFLPGIMGSVLASETLGGIWWFDLRALNKIDQLRLAPGGATDAEPVNQIIPMTTDMAYAPFLSAVMQCIDLGPVIVPYDWRKPLHCHTELLRDAIIRAYGTNGGRNRIHIVAHSMGGLVVRATLMQFGTQLWPLIDRIVFVATPHYGSPAIAGYLKNHLWGFELLCLLGRFLSRETFRSFWGALTLLPAPAGTYPGTRSNDKVPFPLTTDGSYPHPCANFNLYDVAAWKLDLGEQAADLQAGLDVVRQQHEELRCWHLALSQDLRDRMLVIAGVGYKTLFRLAYDSGFLGMWQHTAKVTVRIPGDPHREGDGSVPLASAQLENVPTRYAVGAHASLPNMRSVYEDVFRWLRHQPLQLDATPSAALSRHLAGGPNISDAPALDGTPLTEPAEDNLGRWVVDELDPAREAALRAELNGGGLHELSRVRLL